MEAGAALVGFGLGVLAASAVSWAMIRRHLRRVRAAERRARAAERMAEIGAMTGGLAHEIKNPLSTIGMNAQLLLENVLELSLDEPQRSRLSGRIRALRRETDRLAGILSDFLQYAGEVRLDRRPADLNRVVADLVDFYTPEAERQGVRVRTELHPGELIAPVDQQTIKQALLNLMLNAVQAMSDAPAPLGSMASNERAPGAKPEAGRMLVLRTSAGRDADGREVARIHVADTGPGIPAELLGRLFQPYFTTKAGGSGLGLPTCRRLVEAHGGRVDVSSPPGGGSEFTIVIPRRDD